MKRPLVAGRGHDSGRMSSVPDALVKAPMIELPAGSLDDDPGLRPDKHIYVEAKPPWHTISDSLPQLDKAELAKHRTEQ